MQNELKMQKMQDPIFKRADEFAKRCKTSKRCKKRRLPFSNEQMNLQKDAKRAKDAKNAGSHFQTSR
jgi:hypothetical protein